MVSQKLAKVFSTERQIHALLSNLIDSYRSPDMTMIIEALERMTILTDMLCEESQEALKEINKDEAEKHSELLLERYSSEV